MYHKIHKLSEASLLINYIVGIKLANAMYKLADKLVANVGNVDVAANLDAQLPDMSSRGFQ